MKGSTQTALVLGVGYVLGRRRKLRTVTLMAAAAATGGVGSLGAAAFRRGLNMAGSSEALGDLGPQLSEIAETVRGDLAEAGKTAVLASVTDRVSALSDSLHDRAEAVRSPAQGEPEDEYQGEDDENENGASPVRRRATRSSPVSRMRR